MDDIIIKADIDKITEAQWSDLLERFEDASIYQTWSYGSVHWGEKNLSHLVLRHNGEVVAMTQLRIIHPRFFKGGIAYIRWGPLCHLRGQALDEATVSRMASALHEEYVKKRRLYLRILPSVITGSETASVFDRAFKKYIKKSNSTPTGRTFILDLTPPIELLRKNLDQKWRNQLNRAEKNNLTIVEGTGNGEYQVFAQLYEAMWSRKKFDTTVDINEFARIQEDLPPVLKMRVLICLHQGIPVSSIVCSTVGNTGIYLLGATSDNGLNAKGAYVLQWTMIKWLKEKGFKYYDLGGIDPKANPGVYHFKSGLSGQDVTRLAPLDSCQNILSSILMRAADLAQNGSVTSFIQWCKKITNFQIREQGSSTQITKV